MYYNPQESLSLAGWNSQQPVTEDTTMSGSAFEGEEVSLKKTIEKPKERVPWSSGLFDCLANKRLCKLKSTRSNYAQGYEIGAGCKTLWCPCVTFGQIAEIVDKGSSSCGVNGALYTLIACVTFCPCMYTCFYREKLRQQYLLKKQPYGDCLVHVFCGCCALCQEYRELEKRGYNLKIGWHGNVEEKQRLIELATSPPFLEQPMTR